MNKILVIDNYDSFTYNLVQYLKDLSCVEIVVKRNDLVTLDFVSDFDKILISPGPGIPKEAGLTKAIIKEFGAFKSILGVCLGMQAIAEVYGGKLINLEHVFHGVATNMHVEKKDPLFYEIPANTSVGRYHSWAMDSQNVPVELEVIANSTDNCIMAIRHKSFSVKGVQFHPESVLTPFGKQMIKNWLAL